MTDIQFNLREIKEVISQYEKKYHREEKSVFLLAVTKGQSTEKIRAAVDGGQRAFGENYLQEALPKILELSSLPLDWHFIGTVQRNKTRSIAEHFNWAHSVDNLTVAKRLNDQRPDHLPPLNICIQVNTSGEKSKAGLPPDKVADLIKACSVFPRLNVRGLMSLPEPSSDFIEQRAAYHQLRLLRDALSIQKIKLDTLSMGMSADFEAAIAEGATIVRLGTGIFGSRSLLPIIP